MPKDEKQKSTDERLSELSGILTDEMLELEQLRVGLMQALRTITLMTNKVEELKSTNEISLEHTKLIQKRLKEKAS